MVTMLADTIADIAKGVSASRYLERLLTAKPALADEVAASLKAPVTKAELSGWLSDRQANRVMSEADLKPLLREFKQWAYARIATRDLANLAPLDEVMETMTCIAELAINQAVGVVVGMGKLGGRELNVSSDIDLIFIYPEDGDTGGKKVISNYEFFERLGKQLIQALNEVTEHGQVFRVDMRLRPNGDSGPLVCCFDMLENYFVTQGREWERYAWIKGRVLRGERWTELRDIARPFVFRKYLDFGAINAMRELHAQIRREVARRDRANNVKLGPGGIREIEFIAQVFQLIRGGRDIALQVRPTLKVLALLPERGILSAQAVEELTTAYVFLRRLEHRLQYLDDAQTHDLPTREADQALSPRRWALPTTRRCSPRSTHTANW
jgi:glutamate-ammonia-ligase adenylyltransferase